MIFVTLKARQAPSKQPGKRLSRALRLSSYVLAPFWALFWVAPQAKAGTFTPSQTTFAPTPVSATSQPAVVTLIVRTSGTAQSALALTEGVATPSLTEFSIANNGTCGAAQNLSSGQSCTVSVTFAPRFPGVRHGAVVLKTSGGQVLASTLLSGVGQGGLPVLIPGQISTVAGDGQWFYQGDGVPATQAPIYLPSGLAVDGAGNLFLADSINNRVRRVDALTHTITTVAGNGNAGSAGDGGQATAAEITSPSGLALDGAGNLYVADTGNSTIRRVDAATGVITTVAGTPGASGYTGDGGPATGARLDAPQGIALTPSGDLLIADTANAVIRVVTVSDGTMQTIAGTGTPGYNGDGILALSAQLNEPSAIALRTDGAIAIADLNNNRVRLMTAGGNISTIAGSGTLGYTGDGGDATQAELQGPAAVAFDPAGDLIFADSVNNCVRLVYGTPGTIVTLSGTASDDRYAGDGGPANQARLHGPAGLVFDASGNLWISDRFNNRVREIAGAQLTIGPYSTMKVGKTSQPVPEAMLNAGNQPLHLTAPNLQQAALDAGTTACAHSPLGSAAFCKMGVEFSPTSVGPSINGSITWTSDAPNVTPIDQLYGQVLSVEPTTVALSSNANPALLGQAILLTATVTSADTGRTGTVDFVESGHTWCSAVPLGGDGTAACHIPSLSLGSHNFTGSYSGDNNNAASQSPSFHLVAKQQAALALGVSTSPAVVNSNITLTLSAADTYGTPTGTVVFYDGATALATRTLDSNGNASWSTNSFGVGSHVLTAQYSGDTSNIAATSAATTLEMDKAGSVTVLSSSNGSATVGTAVAFTANIVSNGGPAPTGSVQFVDGASSLGSIPVSSNGSASLTTGALAPGNHAITATYSGDGETSGSTSAILTQTIQQIPTVTNFGADIDPLNAGATVHLAAIVAIAPGGTAAGDLTGTVTFRDGTAVLGTALINASGQATLAVSTLSVGTHTLRASFGGNTNYASSNSTQLNETVQQTPTLTTLNTISSTTLMGQLTTFSAVVTTTAGVPTGTVTYKDGNTVLGTSPIDPHGSSTFSTARLAAGGHTITAVYAGDVNYLSSTSAGLQQTVNLAQATLSLSGPSNAVDAGTAAQFTAALTTPGQPPTGFLTLLDGTVAIATQHVSATGLFTFSTYTLAVGSHLITVAYSGDADNSPATSPALSVSVRQANTQTSLTSDANPLTQGQTLSCTATVTSDSPNETGTVSFYDGSSLLGTVALNPNGTAIFSVQALGLGSHTLTAAYSGDTNHAGSRSAPLAELLVQTAALSLSSNANPSVSGNTVQFSARVSGTPTPTGNVVFRDNGASLAMVPVDAQGVATFATPALSVGAHTVSATYSGDSNFAVETAQLFQAVINASTQVLLTAGANPATFGQPLSLSVNVSSNGGAATGAVQILEGGRVVTATQLGINGNASTSLSTLPPGPHTLTANYLGDGKASPSTSAPLVIVVKQTNSLTITASPNPALTLEAVTFTASLANAGAAPATGVVTWTDGQALLGQATLDASGKAALTLTQLSAGSHTVVASYEGDGANFASSASPLNEVIQLRSTSTTVTGAATDTSNPQQVTLIAVVRGDGSVPPGGSVTFLSGKIFLGAAAVDPTGVATITVIFDTLTQQVTATYAGDASYAASQSSATPIQAGQPAQFTLTISSPNIVLVSHQRTTLAVTLASVKGFTDNIALGCLGLPYAATCTFDTSQLKLGANGTATASLIIDTGNPLGAGSKTSAAVPASRALLCFPPAGLLLAFLLGKRRRRIPALLALLFTFALVTGLSGCGGLQMSGTPPGTYAFEVIGTGQGSNATEAQTVTMVVTQ